jgi:flagellin
MDQLSGEIDRIATTANFNGQKLLDGSIGSNGYVQLEQKNRTMDNGTYSGVSTAASLNTSFDSSSAMLAHGSAKTLKAKFAEGGIQIDFRTSGNTFSAVTLGAVSYDTNGSVTSNDSFSVNYNSNGVAINNSALDLSTRGIKLQIGESSTKADKLEVVINSFHTDSLFAGIEGFRNESVDGSDTSDLNAVARIKSNFDGAANGVDSGKQSTYKQAISIDISDQDRASAAADAIRQVANYVSDERGKLGAQQNRLEHTVNNLTTTSENTTAAKSRILDTDMAKEMMAYTSKNVIAQAAQSMLAQANSQPQNVLSLLQ